MLAVERGVTEADLGRIRQTLDRYPGVWGLLLDAGEDWSGPGVAALVQAFPDGPALLACLELGATDWPPFAVTCLDATRAVRESATDRELALQLGAPWLPEIRDLVVELEADQLPPGPTALGMLEAAIRPSQAYVYAPADYAFRALLVQHVAATSPNWSVRWLR